MLPLFEYESSVMNYGSPFRRLPKRMGRAPQLHSVDLIGLALWYLKGKEFMYRLCPIFGVVPSTISSWLSYSLDVLLDVVRDKTNREFCIEWPSINCIRSSAELLRNGPSGNLLNGIFGIMEVERMPCVSFGNVYTENAYWERYTQAHEVTNLFVWDFKGELIHTAINCPGIWHDSKIASVSGLFAPLLENRTPAGFAILADSAFPRGGVFLEVKLVRAWKANEHDQNNGCSRSTWIAAVDMLLERAIPLERQSAEWGVRALKGLFSRLKTTLPADSYARFRILALCALVHFRVRFVGLNQL